MMTLATLSLNAFADCRNDFQGVVEHNQKNQVFDQQYQLSGNALKRAYQTVATHLVYQVEIAPEIRATKKKLKFQTLILNVMNGNETDSDLEVLHASYNRHNKNISMDAFLSKLGNALDDKENFCMDHVILGDLNNDIQSYRRMNRNIHFITYGQMNDKEFIRMSSRPKTEKEVMEMLKNQK